MADNLTLARITQLKGWEPRTGKLALSDDEFHYLLDLAAIALQPASSGKWNAIHDDDGACRIYEGNDNFRFVIKDEELADRIVALLNQPRVTLTREQLVNLVLNFVHHVITEEGFDAALREFGVDVEP